MNNLTLMNMKFKTASSPQATQYLSVIEIVCDSGYIYNDGSEQKLINCTNSGIWIGQFLCLRMLQNRTHGSFINLVHSLLVSANFLM